MSIDKKNIELNPFEIEKKSHDFIRRNLPNIFGNDIEYEIAIRVAQATGDIEFALGLKFHPEFIDSAKDALAQKLPIFVDVEMAKTALKNYAESVGIDVICAINNPEVIESAKKLGITRSAAAVKKILSERKIGLIVCGNSPTFLYETIRMCESGEAEKPKAVVALPVGFISAYEVKKYLYENPPFPFLTNLSTKGGTPPAVSSAIYLLNLFKKSVEYGKHF